MTKIYLANDLFSDANRAYNELVANKIEQKFIGIEQYIPQRNLSINDKQAYANSSDIAKADYDELKSSDILVAILDSGDLGVALEVGIAYEAGIPIIGLFTDTRQQGADNKKKIEALKEIGENQFVYLNLMLTGVIKKSGALVNNLDDLLQELELYI